MTDSMLFSLLGSVALLVAVTFTLTEPRFWDWVGRLRNGTPEKFKYAEYTFTVNGKPVCAGYCMLEDTEAIGTTHLLPEMILNQHVITPSRYVRDASTRAMRPIRVKALDVCKLEVKGTHGR
jgi:hypothetical protein